MEYFIMIVIILCLSILFLYYVISQIILFNNIIMEINKFYELIDNFKKQYISHSKYMEIKNNYSSLYKITKKYSLIKKINRFNKYYKKLYSNINLMNEEYINKELIKNERYFDTIFSYKLDLEQRKAIITDDDYNLIIAGAGSGKTSTIIGKIKYLIDQKNVTPESILVISFSNNTVDSFKNKLNEVGINNIECLTFHKLGKNNILKYDGKIADDLLDKIIFKYLNEYILKDRKQLELLIELFGLYIHMPNQVEFENLGEIYDYERGFDLETMRNKYNNYLNRENDLYTFQQEKVKSYEELVIANFLFLNGINYVYEKKYDYEKNYNPDFYLTDYDVYLEHFGINEKGRCPQFSPFEEQKYLESINWKREVHKNNNTKLLETYSYYFKNGTIIQRLEEILKKEGIEFKKPDYYKIYEAIIKNNSREEYKSFIELINKFINIFKGNNYKEIKIKEFYEDAVINNNIRNKILLSIIYPIYTLYEDLLTKNNLLDFNDLINKATEHVNVYGYSKKIDYIIVDEFQDTSHSRFMLLKAIIDKTRAKLVIVGDDWQSIYRFSGCDLDLFVNFKKYVKYPKEIFINETHRNSQQLINVAGNFIMKNKDGQIPKNLKSDINNDKPIILYYYNRNIEKALETAIEYLIKSGCRNIGLLGRNKSDNIRPTIKQQDVNITFYTIHKSKGLEFDGTIIINMKNYIAGFPNKMADDPILNYVTASNNDYLYEEERRLFYVALTRTKGKCCILVPIHNQSIFIDEILKDNSKQIDTFMCEEDKNLTNFYCPICRKGKLIVRTNPTDGIKFLGCTNYPKCSYTIKNKHMGVLSNKVECPNCGHYIVKKGGIYGEFYGCTNYPNCKYSFNIDKYNLDYNNNKME